MGSTYGVELGAQVDVDPVLAALHRVDRHVVLDHVGGDGALNHVEQQNLKSYGVRKDSVSE